MKSLIMFLFSLEYLKGNIEIGLKIKAAEYFYFHPREPYSFVSEVKWKEKVISKKKTVTFPLRRSRYDDVKTLLELFQRFEIAKQNSKSITPTVVAATFFYTPQKFGCVSPSPLKLCQTEDDSCLSKYKSKTCEKNMSSFE